MGSVESSKQADLKSISLAGLLAGNDDVVSDLVSACKENGFFYLDFRHESTCGILKLVDDLAAIGKSVFKLPLEEKEQYSTEKYLPSRLFGYVLFCSTYSDDTFARTMELKLYALATNESGAPLDHLPGRKTVMRASRYVPTLPKLTAG
uniref:Non-haem dioxygenase N-terminal domain-containing protein n=1 Tax=Photinus pyralis TaxID=7054 RepID=A0A1Y1MGR5_PHOPY